MGSELNKLTIAEARAGLNSKSFSAVELTKAHMECIANATALNAFVTETPEIAIQSAKESDHRRTAGNVSGSMDGIPIAIKDLFCTAGVQCSAGSRILEGFIPSYESTVSHKLIKSGAIMVGKSNMDEFAMGSANITSYYGNVINPWKSCSGASVGKDLVPGGSSGGSAAIIAARLALGATGTDTGGSIRQPASFTGVVGMKPTYGRCSRWGVIAFASSLDQAGPMTRTVRDSAIMLTYMAGHDSKDATSVSMDVPNFENALVGNINGMRIGIPKEYIANGMSQEISDVWSKGADMLKKKGADIIEVSLPHTKYALPAYYIIAPAEASSNLARYDGVRYGLRVEGKTLDDMYMDTRAEGFGSEVQRRVLIGTYVLSAGYYEAYYVKAQKVRTCIANDFNSAFESVDVLLTPTTPTTAFAIGDKRDDPLSMYLNDVFTVPASLSGLPAISIPVSLASDGLPLGLQLIAKPFDEATLFRVAHELEAAAEFVLPDLSSNFAPEGTKS